MTDLVANDAQVATATAEHQLWADCPEWLATTSKEISEPLTSLEMAKHLDSKDELKVFRSQFHIPPTPESAKTRSDTPESIYLCGNSLGLQPKATRALVLEEMDKWAQLGVEGHFQGKRPWAAIGELCVDGMATVVGAKPIEVGVMNTLTVNLHLMLVSFYRPTPTRFKILMEAKAFPSDRQAIMSQIMQRGYSLEHSLIELSPRDGETCIRQEDIEKVISEQGQEIALVMFSGVQYYTGQRFNIEAITKAAQAQGCCVGFDLAHAVANVPLKLHDWGPDFACWCTYKYLNAGPGAVGGLFVHERHANSPELPRLAGWWGHRASDRFKMTGEFIPTPGAQGWGLSNPPMLPVVCIQASLEMFGKAGMERLREKSLSLTCYLEYVLGELLPAPRCRFLTPDHSQTENRGCQLSIVMNQPVGVVHERLLKEGVICDKREPDVLRVAPVPMYNSYEDVLAFVQTLKAVMDEFDTSTAEAQ